MAPISHDPRPTTHDPGGVREESKASLRACWVVLARRKYDEPLCQVGTVTAEDPDMAAMFAQSIYDEHPWIEMVVVPRRAMRTVVAS
jgi:1,2-phenylacetyl-CoA epoxidase PaaB subunit